MRAKIFKLDAFASRLFTGNPAAVILMDAFPDDALMQSIAGENNLAETAFLVRENRDYRLRWFTPTVEVPLCGHATLASAAVVMERLEPARTSVTFQSKSGPLIVERTEAGYVMDFPVRHAESTAMSDDLVDALGARPVEVLIDPFNYLAVFDEPGIVRRLAPDLIAVAQLNRSGVVVTAPGDGGYDCVSRYFAPAKGIPEDPVTGGAHCALTPYWTHRLGKHELRAYQASARGGELRCRMLSTGSRVQLGGCCVFYLEGEVTLGGN